MTVVTLDSADRRTVLRGTAASEWLNGHTFLTQRQILLVLPGDREENGLLCVTTDFILCLALACENLSDFIAHLSFDLAFETYIKQEAQRHAR